MSSSDPLIGQQLGNYLIQKPLGRGGMARVYKGLDIGLKRPVAIKVIREGLRTSANYAQRFEREAQSVANLKHPNIVTVFWFGKQEDLYYLVMEYIDGADLDAVQRSYSDTSELMPHSDVIRILSATGSALDYAHTQGVIHRDVKPSNIMLEQDGRPVLTDFGLALRVNEGTIGETFGSPHYISPEQARNSANAVPQSDLYSLGVIAFELLTGTVPFDDPSPTALAMQHILATVPSARAYNPVLSDQVDAVLTRCLAKTPGERFQSGTEFVAALQQSLDALKQYPASAISSDLPPLPPGVSYEPRRLSMQTAFDKVHQTLAFEQAKGQSLTRIPETVAAKTRHRPQSGRSRYMLLSVLATGFLAIGIALVVLLGRQNAPSPAVVQDSTQITVGVTNTVAFATSTSVPTRIIVSSTDTPPMTTSAPTVAVTSMVAVASPSLTATVIMPIAPTVTPIPATSTSTSTMTQIPQTPTATLTWTPVPPTATVSMLPSPALMLTSTPLPLVSVPTVAHPNGMLFILGWDEIGLYAANQSGQRIASSNLTFERILTGGSVGDRFEGRRWSQYYAWSEPRKCLVVNTGRLQVRLPPSDCPGGTNSEIWTQAGETFWTQAANSTVFRVLWKGGEVARCEIAARRCEVRFPPD